MGVQGAKPPEADKFLHVKGVFSLALDNEHMKIYVKKIQTGVAHARRAIAKSSFVCIESNGRHTYDKLAKVVYYYIEK
jgi:hypothetical protein